MAIRVGFWGGCFAAVSLAVLSGCSSSQLPDVPSGSEAYKLVPAPVQADTNASYMIAATDVIAIQVFQEPDLSSEKIQVDDVGKIQMPLIGEVQAAGRTTSELAEEIAQKLRQRYIVNPQVAVSVSKSATQFVTVEGEVKKPGVYEIERNYTLLSAIARAESPTKTARLNEVLIFRNLNGQRLGARFDIADIRAGRAADPQVINGDVVVVGKSSSKNAWQDVLQAAPLLNLFYVIGR